jgi:hypothetical protein
MRDIGDIGDIGRVGMEILVMWNHGKPPGSELSNIRVVEPVLQVAIPCDEAEQDGHLTLGTGNNDTAAPHES